MRTNFWLCVMQVMSRLGVFKPYVRFIDKFLQMLDGTSSWEIEESKEWILNQEDYPHLNKFRGWYGYGWEYIIKELLSDGHIILDDNVIIYTGINSPKLQRLVDESVMLS